MRLIDADALCMHLSDWQFGSMTDGKHETEYEVINKVIDGIEKEKTVNAVAVVRCKDCVHWEEQRRRKYNGNQYDESICDHLSDTFGTWDVFTAEDFFCADGERRSEPEEGGTDDVPKTD